ncbi:MAG: 4Fe-4S binding protein [Anaerolineales bacterium]|nr:4Fe-4S binding protein [Anaerolineales bacterium]
MEDQAYQRLARHLDALPNGFPPTASGIERRLLAKLYTPEQADLAARLRLRLESPEQIAARTGLEFADVKPLLKTMARHGLIAVGRADKGLGYGALPFVVGIYEMQVGTIDGEMAQLFEDYYQQAFHQALTEQPPIHRVIPVGESLRTDIEIHPFENASDLLAGAAAWGVLDCICRKQKALIGDGCDHPLDVCLAMSHSPGAFDHNPTIRSLTRQEALATLHRAAEAGLVHSVSNAREGVGYVCNCCTCSCGVLRGLAELGLANVVARSAFVCQVDADLCTGCELCLERCQFGAMAFDGIVQVDSARCVGCGVCGLACPDHALTLWRRPEDEVKPPPATEAEWRLARAQSRGIDLHQVV